MLPRVLVAVEVLLGPIKNLESLPIITVIIATPAFPPHLIQK